MHYLAIGDGLSTAIWNLISFGRTDKPSRLLQSKEVTVDGATPLGSEPRFHTSRFCVLTVVATMALARGASVVCLKGET